MPANVTLDELKELIARAASPKVKAENVTIAYSDAIDPYLASDKPVNLPKPDESGNPWWLTVALVVLGLIFGFLFVSKKLKKKAEEQQQEVDALRQKSAEQEKQLREVNLKASQLIEKQAQFAQGLMEQQALSQQVAAQITNQQNAAPAPQLQTNENLQDVLDDVRADIIQNDSDELVEQVKSWIEKA